MRTTAFIVAMLAAAPVAAAQEPGSTRVVSGGRGASLVQTPLILEIGVRRYEADGRLAAQAGESTLQERFESYVWANSTLCGLSSSDTEPQSVPGVGWRFSGRIVSRSTQQIVLHVEWRRLWQNGARLSNGPGGNQTITLRNGERFELDRVTPAGNSNCGAVEAKLEASVVARPVTRLATTTVGDAVAAGTGRGGGRAGFTTSATTAGVGSGTASNTVTTGRGAGRGGVATAGRGTTSVTGRAGGGAATGVGQGAAATATTTGTRGGRGGVAGGSTFSGTLQGAARGGVASTTVQGQTGAQGRSTAQGQAGVQGQSGAQGQASTTVQGRGGRSAFSTNTVTQGSAVAGRGGFQTGLFQGGRTAFSTQTYEAELWLVHRRPDGTEAVQLQTLRFGGPERSYAFPPVQVTTSKGSVTVDITGKLQAIVGDPPDPSRPGLVYVMRSRPADDSQKPRIIVSLARRARSASPVIDTTGSSSMLVDLPSPNDVLSFEFPALQKATEDLLAGHRFSLRVKVTTVQR